MNQQLEIRLGDLLRHHSLKLATAESCTGGLISDRITDIPGSSDYFLGGFVAYAYRAKVASLGVSWDTLNAHGAVSQETVLEMAHGAIRSLGADLALAVSGIAGPGGGLADKPVGTVWVALVTAEGEWAQVFHFDKDRRGNKEDAAEAALMMLIEYLETHV